MTEPSTERRPRADVIVRKLESKIYIPMGNDRNVQEHFLQFVPFYNLGRGIQFYQKLKSSKKTCSLYQL